MSSWASFCSNVECNSVECFGEIEWDNYDITGSAVALHCCKAHTKINRKMGNSTVCKIVTPENIILKLCIRDYVGDMTHHANFGFNRCSGGFSPKIGEMLAPCEFFWLSCPVLTFFLDPVPRSNRWTDFHALWLKRCVSAQGNLYAACNACHAMPLFIRLNPRSCDSDTSKHLT